MVLSRSNHHMEDKTVLGGIQLYIYQEKYKCLYSTNTSHGCNQAVVLGGIGAIVILSLSHNSCVASDLLIDAASKNKAAGVPLVG